MSSPDANAVPDGSREPFKGGTVPRLSLRGIAKGFDTNLVLSGIDLDAFAGEVVALLGENGTGKIHYLVDHRGALRSLPRHHGVGGGQPYAPTRPGEATEAGIVLIHQEMRLLPQLSIAENVFVGRLL